MLESERIPGPAAGPTGLFWSQLLSRLKERQLIPVVGQDAIEVEDDLGRCTLNEYLARRVEAFLELEPADPPARTTLHAVACRYLKKAGQIDDVYSAVKEVWAERPLPVPDSLRKLARIDAFKLYVTTTFDDLLQRAVDEERFPGRRGTRSFAYSPGRVEDLPGPVAEMDSPVVYHLLGRLSALQDYVVTEEDTLEFVHSLHSETRRPNLLLDEMRSHSLLLIGSGFSDWLMLFFLRIAKRERLLLARSRTQFLVDTRTREPALGDFLRHFSAQTKVFPGGALEFIDQLSARWEALREAEPGDAPPPPPERAAEHAIFVSYASEDRPRAQKLAEALRGAGLPVWFDRTGGLQGGDDYEQEIRTRIRDASFFAPVLSRNVLTPERRFFRVEWDEALDEERRVAENQHFIVPIRIDDLPPDTPGLPERFRKLQWLPLGEGAELGDTVQYLQKLYRRYQLARSTTP
ncbi:MAG: toll/interleukin-1 receptor domain-containing protein [Longimicrobiaceae bacterium]